MKPMQWVATKALFASTIVIFSLSMLLFISAIAMSQGKLAGIGAVLLFVWVCTGVGWLLCWYNEPDPRPASERQDFFNGW